MHDFSAFCHCIFFCIFGVFLIILAFTVSPRKRPFQCYGCMLCQQAQKSRAGEAVHMNKRHGKPSTLRHLYSGSSCPGCLKEFHVPERVHQHLRTAKSCRDYLDAYGWSIDLAPGKGTKEHGDYELAHNGLLPHQQALGPLREAPAQREERHYDESLLEDIIDHLEAHPADPAIKMINDLRHLVCTKPIPWVS